MGLLSSCRRSRNWITTYFLCVCAEITLPRSHNYHYCVHAPISQWFTVHGSSIVARAIASAGMVHINICMRISACACCACAARCSRINCRTEGRVHARGGGNINVGGGATRVRVAERSHPPASPRVVPLVYNLVERSLCCVHARWLRASLRCVPACHAYMYTQLNTHRNRRGPNAT